MLGRCRKPVTLCRRANTNQMYALLLLLTPDIKQHQDVRYICNACVETVTVMLGLYFRSDQLDRHNRRNSPTKLDELLDRACTRLVSDRYSTTMHDLHTTPRAPPRLTVGNFCSREKTRSVNTISTVTLPVSLRSKRSPDHRNRMGISLSKKH